VAAGVGIAIGVASLGGGQALAQAGGQPAASPAGLKIATVDVLKIVERHMARPELDSARSTLVKSWQDQINAVDAELKALQQQAQGLAQTDPKMQELGAQYQAKQENYQKMSQTAQAAVDKLLSTQMVEGFDAVRGAIKTIAARNGYTLVLMSRPAAEPIDPTNQNLVLQQILARPVLEATGSTDITEVVIAELKLPPPATPETPAMPPGGQK
jgi:Skp family chaperone for outer membrane proteins